MTRDKYLILRRVAALVAIASAVLAVAVACGSGYETESVSVEVKYPPVSGVELSGRSMGVVYTHNDIPEDSLFSANLAEAFTAELEDMYFGGSRVLDVFKVHRVPDGTYGALDTLVRLVLDTECDVVFLIDCERGEDELTGESDSFPLVMNLYVYDSLDPEDHGVRYFKGSTNVSNDTMAASLGSKAASKFAANWKHETFNIYYYLDDAWWGAYVKASEMDWAGALKDWVKLTETNNLVRRSCAEYNCAVACYMLGDLDLAEKWLDQSDKDDRRNSSPTLRRRIAGRR